MSITLPTEITVYNINMLWLWLWHLWSTQIPLKIFHSVLISPLFSNIVPVDQYHHKDRTIYARK